MYKQRRSKDMLRKEEQRVVEEMRKLDLEIAKNDLREDNGEELSWAGNDSDSRSKKLERLRTELEEIQRELGDSNLA